MVKGQVKRNQPIKINKMNKSKALKYVENLIKISDLYLIEKNKENKEK